MARASAASADAAHRDTVELAGVDTIHVSAACEISEEVRKKLDAEKELAQLAAKGKAVHCPEWLGAQVLPHGSRGGYGHLLETNDFSVKILGKGIPHRPGLYVELRSHFLHTHPRGPRGACEEALCWVREQLLYDQDDEAVREQVAFASVRLSRVDLHADWQGGWVPSAELGSSLHFIKPARVKWHAYHDGGTFTGFVFGSDAVMARVYEKSRQARQRSDDAYFALLSARSPTRFDPEQAVWRLEYQLRREGTTGFRLYTPPDIDDDDATIEAELSAEDLPHLGTLPRFFAHQDKLWRHLTTYWLRLVEDDGTANRSRWPAHPTWTALREGYQGLASAEPLGDVAQELVRGARYTGKSRILRRMLLGIFSARGVLPLELKPAHSVGDLLVQHLDDLEREAEDKGGLDQVLADHFSRIYKVAAPRDLFNPASPAKGA